MSIQASTDDAGAVAKTSAGPPNLGVALLVIAAAQLMLTLDDTIVNVALPSIQRSLNLPASHLNWIASFYALSFGGLLLAGGRAGDLFGRLRLFRFGLVVFAVASMVGGLAPNDTVLITARLVQGVGAAVAAPGALSLLATTFPEGPARTKALGVYGAMAGMGSVLGLLVGGALTEYVSWRWVMFISVPLALAVLLGSRTLVPGERERGSLDIVGAISATLGVASIVYGLTSGNTDGWGDPVTVGCFVAGAVLLAAFVVRECTQREPLVPTRVVRDRSRAGAYTVMLTLGAGMLAMFYLLTLYMQIVRGYPPLRAGLAYLPFVAGIGVSAGGLGPGLLGRLPVRVVVSAGMIIFAGGLAWCASQLTPTSNYFVAILPTLFVGGVGGGLVFVGATTTGMHGVEPRQSGAAAGMTNTAVQVGASIGLSALASIASIVSRRHMAGHTMAGALTDGYVAGLIAGAAVFALGAIVATATITAKLSPDEIPH